MKNTQTHYNYSMSIIANLINVLAASVYMYNDT